MCGIVGVASRRELPSERRLDAMRKAIVHRGPDASGAWHSTEGGVCLAHNRLAIIDLSEDANQPLSDHAGRCTIVYNGEIYNYRELRDQLQSAGHEFRTDSDTEVLVEAYLEWGVDCLDRVNGMFAFALYDHAERRLFLARDRAGEKPLFYRHDGEQLWFASELKALLTDDAMPRELDYAALDYYLAYGYVPHNQSILRGYHKLPQGHAATYDVDRDRLRTWRYWQLPQPGAQPVLSLADASRRAEQLLEQAVKRQLVADVPVGVLLSGGLDSSLITALASRSGAGPVRTFTVTFPGHGKLDEGPHARRVAEFFGTEHTELEGKSTSIDMLPTLARQFDEPMADAAIVPTSLVAQKIREHCAVALGGDGGDELFGGYNHYNLIQWVEAARRLAPRFARAAVSALTRRFVPPGVRGRNHLVGFAADLGFSLAHINLYYDQATRFELAPGLRGRTAERAEAYRARLCNPAQSAVQQAMRADFRSTLVDGYLVKVDRASMLHSLEVRAPFLDYQLIEFAFGGLADEQRASWRQRKVLLRDMATRLLPPEFDRTRKQGFSIPIADWFKGEWGEFVRDTLLSADQRVFDHQVIRGLLAGQERGLLNGVRLFGLVMFELWRREYRINV